MEKKLRFDEVGSWSEIKLDIIKKYAAAYSEILSRQSSPPFHHVYIDAFAGAGIHLRRRTREFVRGSPLNALNIDPPFREYHLIDTDARKIRSLQELVGSRRDVFIYEGDCNRILLQKVFPRVEYKHYRRGLCILDPYGLDLEWKVIETAGQMKTIDLFLNFPVADMNRNVLWHQPEKVTPAQAARMTAYWGDESWREIAYTTKGMPMRNSKNAIVYYLFFASPKDTAENIVLDIFQKNRNRGAADVF